jgi:hypothetical protein
MLRRRAPLEPPGAARRPVQPLASRCTDQRGMAQSRGPARSLGRLHTFPAHTQRPGGPPYASREVPQGTLLRAAVLYCLGASFVRSAACPPPERARSSPYCSVSACKPSSPVARQSNSRHFLNACITVPKPVSRPGFESICQQHKMPEMLVNAVVSRTRTGALSQVEGKKTVMHT